MYYRISIQNPAQGSDRKWRLLPGARHPVKWDGYNEARRLAAAGWNVKITRHGKAYGVGVVLKWYACQKQPALVHEVFKS